MEERTTQKPKSFRKAAHQDSTQRAAVGRAVLRLRLDSMMAGPVQPHTNENSEARGASAGYFGRLSSIPSRS